MKTKKIKIAVVEDDNFYNQIIKNQISDLYITKDTPEFKFEITTVTNVNDLMKDNKSGYQMIVFDNHFKNNRQQADYDVFEMMESIKSKNKDCFFISISGYREMNISAYLYKEGELQFTYSKQSALRNANHEEQCSIPALHKLIDRFIGRLLKGTGQTSHLIAA